MRTTMNCYDSVMEPTKYGIESSGKYYDYNKWIEFFVKEYRKDMSGMLVSLNELWYQ